MVNNWGLIEDLRQRRAKIIDEVLANAYQSFTEAVEAQQVVAGGSLLSSPNKSYFGIRITQDGVQEAAATWVVSEMVTLADETFGDFAGRATEVAVAQLVISKVLAEIVAANMKA